MLKINDFELPGKKSMIKLAPPGRIKQIKEGFNPINPKSAAVLILFYGDEQNQTRVVLILRNTYDGVHSNQVSFPGGKKEKKDPNLESTALRETCEELGIRKKQIKIVSSLSKIYIPPSNFDVQPYIGFCNEYPFFNPCKIEVSELITPFFKDLIKMKIVNSSVLVKNKKIVVPSFIIENKIVWGATSMIISEFISLFKKIAKS